ncbi:MAG TPA: hypothetical protein VD886_00070 [Herpetosiphonaceae bacterium]|nr:hypothetical protein [Herpetosiphonaceae bacterium]
MTDHNPFYPVLRALAQHRVRYVVAGSMAARLHGVPDVHPGDLDIVPARDSANLRRLRLALTALGATAEPASGAWERDDRGEWAWKTAELTSAERAAWQWQPNVDDWQTFDRGFTTPYGQLDVVPQIAGTYEELVGRAEPQLVRDLSILIVSLADLLARLTVPRRAKDVERVRQLRLLQARRATARPNEAPADPQTDDPRFR